MKSLTLKEIKGVMPYWLGIKRYEEIFQHMDSAKESWTALDVLELPMNALSTENKLWLVLRPEFLSERVLHLFACEAVDQALRKIENPEPVCLETIRVKRLWMNGKASDIELLTAQDAVRNFPWNKLWDWSRAATIAATGIQGYSIAFCSSTYAAYAVASFKSPEWNSAWYSARDAAFTEQVKILIKIIKENDVS